MEKSRAGAWIQKIVQRKFRNRCLIEKTLCKSCRNYKNLTHIGPCTYHDEYHVDKLITAKKLPKIKYYTWFVQGLFFNLRTLSISKEFQNFVQAPVI